MGHNRREWRGALATGSADTCTAVSHRRAGTRGTNGAPHLPCLHLWCGTGGGWCQGTQCGASVNADLENPNHDPLRRGQADTKGHEVEEGHEGRAEDAR